MSEHSQAGLFGFHAKTAQNQIVLSNFQFFYGFGSGGGDIHPIPASSQHRLQGQARSDVVFDQQDSGQAKSLFDLLRVICYYHSGKSTSISTLRHSPLITRPIL